MISIQTSSPLIFIYILDVFIGNNERHVAGAYNNQSQSQSMVRVSSDTVQALYILHDVVTLIWSTRLSNNIDRCVAIMTINKVEVIFVFDCLIRGYKSSVQ